MLNNQIISLVGLGKMGLGIYNRLYNENLNIYGYDINEESLDRVKNEFGVIPVNADELMSMDLDVFSPCAMGAVLNPSSIENLKCSVIAGAANNQPMLEYGRALAMTDDFLVVGMPGYGRKARGRHGAVQVLGRGGDSWVTQAILTPADAGDDGVGATAVGSVAAALVQPRKGASVEAASTTSSFSIGWIEHVE